MTDFEVARHNMVESQVRPAGVFDDRILAAMAAVPRERFVPQKSQTVAYLDGDIAVTDGTGESGQRYLIEPRVIARLADIADIDSDDLVLDVGPATGYSTALLAQLADTVVAIEADAALAESASSTLGDLGISNAAVIEGDHAAGNAKQGPFDVIFLNGAVPEVPASLLDQLKPGGRLVAVVGCGQGGKGRVYTKGSASVGHRDVFDAKVAALPGFEVEEGFTF